MNCIDTVNNYCYIFNKKTKTVLGLHQEKISTRTKVELQTKLPSKDIFQQWQFIFDDQHPTWFKIKNLASGHYLATSFQNLIVNGKHRNIFDYSKVRKKWMIFEIFETFLCKVIFIALTFLFLVFYMTFHTILYQFQTPFDEDVSSFLIFFRSKIGVRKSSDLPLYSLTF